MANSEVKTGLRTQDRPTRAVASDAGDDDGADQLRSARNNKPVNPGAIPGTDSDGGRGVGHGQTGPVPVAPTRSRRSAS